MKFLVDESVSFRVSDSLVAAGHDSIHVVKDLERGGARDEELVLVARNEDRVLVSADTDFGELLARGGRSLPSLILFRRDRRAPVEH